VGSHTSRRSIPGPLSQFKIGTRVVKPNTNIRNIIGNEVNNVTKMRASINTKLYSIAVDPKFDRFYKNGALLSLPPVNGPFIRRIDPGRISFVAHNDSHSKESNFGYSRNSFGGSYNH
jgi:hypothetical protein